MCSRNVCPRSVLWSSVVITGCHCHVVLSQIPPGTGIRISSGVEPRVIQVHKTQTSQPSIRGHKVQHVIRDAPVCGLEPG